MKKTLTNPPRLVFKQLNGFQAIDEQGKIKTILFLNASREVVTLIGKMFNFGFGVVFVILIDVQLCKQQNSVEKFLKSSKSLSLSLSLLDYSNFQYFFFVCSIMISHDLFESFIFCSISNFIHRIKIANLFSIQFFVKSRCDYRTCDTVLWRQQNFIALPFSYRLSMSLYSLVLLL